MQKRVTILYSIVWIAYVAFTLIMFPVWNSTVIIPGIPLLALGAWLYGTTTGLLIALAAIIHLSILTSFIFADFTVYYMNRLVGPLVSITVVFLCGHLRNNLNAIKITNHNLDRLVEERKSELALLAEQLINDSEQRRVLHGQWLHDGIGQHLTGIQLYCASLADQLLAESNPSAAIAFAISKRCHSTHNQIRQLARMLFPIKIGDVGLIPALHELSSCFIDLENVDFSIRQRSELPELPENTALQIYRICQENANYAIYHLNASQVDIQIHATQLTYTLTFGHNGSSKPTEGLELLKRLIDYRLEQIYGTVSSGYSVNHVDTIIYTIPNPELRFIHES